MTHIWVPAGVEPRLAGRCCRLNSELWLLLFSVIQSTDYIKKIYVFITLQYEG